MRRMLIAAVLVVSAAACGNGTTHLGSTNAKASAPAATVVSGGNADATAIRSDLATVDREMSVVSGELSKTDGDLANSNESDVQR